MEKVEFFKKLKSIITQISNDPDGEAFRIIGKEFGFLDSPKKKGLKDLADFEVLYRGFREKTHIKKFLVSDENNFYIGVGNNYGKGIYSSRSEDIALDYTKSRDLLTDKDKVLKIYIKDCNIIEFFKLKSNELKIYDIIKYNEMEVIDSLDESIKERAKAFVEFALSLNDNDLEILLDFMNYEMTAMAMILGYDIIDLSLACEQPNYLILNRGKIHVLDEDHKKFIGNGKRFRKVASEKLPQRIQKGE